MNNEYMIFKEHAIVQFRSITIKLLWSLNTLRKVMNFYVLILDLFYIYMSIFPAYIYVPCTCLVFRSPGTGVRNDFECGC